MTIGDTIYADSFFTPTFPNDDTFDYSWRFSTNVLEKYTDNGVEKGRINLSLLKNSPEFNSGANAQIDSRIYLIANKTINGYTYSRVMQSYVCEFYSNGSTNYNDGTYSFSIFMDHREGEGSTYHHGNNIGYLAGHVDGIMKDCYVYNGTFNVNNTADQVHIDTESQTGLVGEIGINVENSIDPDIGLTTKGDTGIMNFSGIYKMIRNDAAVGTSLWSNFGYDSSGNRISFFSYNNLLNEGYVNYKDYLRTDDSSSESTKHYISKYNSAALVTDNGVNMSATSGELQYINTVDFKYNKVIQDTAEVDRGLGVFKLATSDGGANPTYLDQIGKCQIINGTALNKVYFSTAELDHTKFGYGEGLWNDTWGLTAPSASKYYCEIMDTMPTYGDTRTWDPILERDLNFYIEMDLSQASAAAGKNFFYNTDSPFLTEYLRYKLINKEGEKLDPGEKRFGFMFRDAEGVVIDSLSSYMPVKKPTAKFSYRESDGSYKYYPSNTITFRIDNPNGANVSVVATGTNNTTIFSYNPDSSSASDITPVYSMFTSPSDKVDSAPYFTYDVTDGTTSTVATVPPATKDTLKRGGKLIGHIFKLPQGDYCIGCDTAGDAKSSNIYMLAVQGQTESNIGDVEIPSLGAAEVDVDFLLFDPEGEKKKAKFSFRITMNSSPGLFVVTGSGGYIVITFDVSDAFVDSLTTYDRNSSIHYQVNGVDQSVSNYKYTR